MEGSPRAAHHRNSGAPPRTVNGTRMILPVGQAGILEVLLEGAAAGSTLSTWNAQATSGARRETTLHRDSRLHLPRDLAVRDTSPVWRPYK